MAELLISTIFLIIIISVVKMERRAHTPPAEQGTKEATTRTHPPRPFKVEQCDNVAMYCFKAYTTGRVCGRSVENRGRIEMYHTFKNQCELDFLNCNEGHDVWVIAHMGQCMNREYVPAKHFEYYEYWEDLFLDHNYAINE